MVAQPLLYFMCRGGSYNKMRFQGTAQQQVLRHSRFSHLLHMRGRWGQLWNICLSKGSP